MFAAEREKVLGYILADSSRRHDARFYEKCGNNCYAPAAGKAKSEPPQGWLDLSGLAVHRRCKQQGQTEISSR
jgi:hypothetical protein